jgi:hypothetical protein
MKDERAIRLSLLLFASPVNRLSMLHCHNEELAGKIRRSSAAIDCALFPAADR